MLNLASTKNDYWIIRRVRDNEMIAVHAGRMSLGHVEDHNGVWYLEVSLPVNGQQDLRNVRHIGVRTQDGRDFSFTYIAERITESQFETYKEFGVKEMYL